MVLAYITEPGLVVLDTSQHDMSLPAPSAEITLPDPAGNTTVRELHEKELLKCNLS